MPRAKKKSETAAAAPKEAVAAANDSPKEEAKPAKKSSYKVVQVFQCKHTYKMYEVGSDVSGLSSERLAELEEKGLLEAE